MGDTIYYQHVYFHIKRIKLEQNYIASSASIYYTTSEFSRIVNQYSTTEFIHTRYEQLEK